MLRINDNQAKILKTKLKEFIGIDASDLEVRDIGKLIIQFVIAKELRQINHKDNEDGICRRI